MNWEAVGAISDAIGVVGVIASLAYLGVQVRQSNHATQAATVDQITGRFISWLQNSGKNENLFLAYRDGLSAMAEMTLQSRSDVFANLAVLFRMTETIHYQRVKGFVDDEVWLGWQNWIASVKSYEVVQYYWQAKAPNHSAGFRVFWDALPASQDASLMSLIKSVGNPV